MFSNPSTTCFWPLILLASVVLLFHAIIACGLCKIYLVLARVMTCGAAQLERKMSVYFVNECHLRSLVRA